MRGLQSVFASGAYFVVKLLHRVTGGAGFGRRRVRLLAALYASGKDEYALAELKSLGAAGEGWLEEWQAATPPGSPNVAGLLLKRLRGPKRKKDRAEAAATGAPEASAGDSASSEPAATSGPAPESGA